MLGKRLVIGLLRLVLQVAFTVQRVVQYSRYGTNAAGRPMAIWTYVAVGGVSPPFCRSRSLARSVT